jgi:DNA-binding winged helix-turn-helix (wHTH) protein
VVLRFDTFELDMDRFELRQAGEPVRMEPQVFDVLAYLVVNRDRLVTKDELLEKVWGDKYVSEAALNSRLMAARRAIGDNGRDQRLIRTMHGRGFRFVGEAEESSEMQPGTRAPAPKPALTPRLEQEVRFCTSIDGSRIA